MTSSGWKFGAIAVALAAAASAHAEPHSQARRLIMTEHQVEQSLAANNLEVTAEQVHFPCSVSISDSNVVPRLVRVESKSNGAATLRMRCDKISQCIPFLVDIRWSNPSAMRAALAGMQPPRLVSKATSRVRRRADVNAGNAATLLLQSEHMTATLRVVCLQSGAIGDRIRVSTRDRKKQYVAEILDQSTVLVRM